MKHSLSAMISLSISSHLSCEVFICCPEVKLRAVWRLEVMLNKRPGVFYRGIKPRGEAEWIYSPIRHDPRVIRHEPRVLSVFWWAVGLMPESLLHLKNPRAKHAKLLFFIFKFARCPCHRYCVKLIYFIKQTKKKKNWCKGKMVPVFFF